MNSSIETIGSFIMIISVFMTLAWVIIAALNYSLKKKMLNMGPIDDNALKLLSKPVESKLKDLKWGLLFFFGGLGLVVLGFLPYRGDESPLPYGVEAIFLSIGFIIYYLIATRKKA